MLSKKIYKKYVLPKEQGFTLIELLVVIVIIGVLAAIALPIFMNQQKAAADATVKSDLRNIGLGMETFFVKNSHYPFNVAEFTQTDIGISDPGVYKKTNNLLFCLDMNASKYYVFAESISGNVYSFSSEGGLKTVTSGWSSTMHTTCPSVGIAPNDVGSNADWGYTNSSWKAWVKR